jgi:hypothetical protein
MSPEILEVAEETLTFDVEELVEPNVVVIGSIPENYDITDAQATCDSKSSCYTATCTWAECCNPPCP